MCILYSSIAYGQSRLPGESSAKVSKDIPHDDKGNYQSFYRKKIELEKRTGYRSLENGFDSLEIRVWYSVALENKLQLLIIKRQNGKWSADLNSMNLKYGQAGNAHSSISKAIEPKQPVSGWKKLIDSLTRLDIFTLRDSHNIDGYGESTDGYGVTIEFATLTKYRIYNIPNFNSQIGIQEAKNAGQIMDLLEREFTFKRIQLEKHR